jgi:hypothetical protein
MSAAIAESTHPLMLIRNLLRMQSGALPPGMKLEHELHSEFCEAAIDRSELATFQIKAAAAELEEVRRQVDVALRDEFSRTAVFSRIEKIATWHASILEKIALGALAVAITAAACGGGRDEDAWRIQRTTRLGPRVARREVV